VSYALELQVDAQRRFVILPIDVQEEVLDLLDQLAATATPRSMTVLRYDEDHLFLYRNGRTLYRIVLSIDCDHASRKLTVFDLRYSARL
jgi:hypothetical protein